MSQTRALRKRASSRALQFPGVFGRETARQFLEEGARVMICGRNAQTIEKARAELAKQTGGEVHAVVADGA